MAGCNLGFLELSGAKTRYNETRAALFKTRADHSKVDEDEVEVPALVMITHREASVSLNTSRKMSDDDESERKEEEGEQAGAVQEEKLLEVLLSVETKAGAYLSIDRRCWPRLAEAGGRPELDLALTGKPLGCCFFHTGAAAAAGRGGVSAATTALERRGASAGSREGGLRAHLRANAHAARCRPEGAPARPPHPPLGLPPHPPPLDPDSLLIFQSPYTYYGYTYYGYTY